MSEQVEHVRGEPVKADAVAATVRAYVGWKARQPHASQYREDIAQEAALTVLERQPEAKDAFQVCRRYVGWSVCRWRSPVTLPVQAFDAGPTVAAGYDDAHHASRVTPEDRAAAAEILARWCQIKAELLAAEDEAARDLPPVVREIGATVLERRREGEADGVHVELAQVYAVTVKRVTTAVERYERAVDKSEAVARWRREMRALRREALS